MSKEKDPAFLMYSKDWLSGTAEYMPDEKGVYIDLLCHQHQRKDLPCDTERLARMVGLSHEQFLKVWSVISCHFEQIGDRLVNRKLQGLMRIRADKGLTNTITGTFAAILRLGNYSSREYKHLKANFNPSSFTQFPKEEITERLTEWLSLCLKSIGNGNEDVFNNYKGVLQKVLNENNISLPDGFEPLISEWLKYKSEKGQSYKETGMKSLVNKFLKDSNNDVNIGREMLEYSMSKNYAGLFKEKINGNNGSNQQNNSRGVKRVNAAWDREN